jgi:hypothetical protein
MKNSSYPEFIQFLKNNSIHLFDAQYRIAHFRFKNLNFQNGGGIGNDINVLKKLNKCYLTHFIDALIYNNQNRINWILNNI